MSYVFGILGLAVACVVWMLLQRATAGPGECRHDGGCGACTQRRCESKAATPEAMSSDAAAETTRAT